MIRIGGLKISNYYKGTKIEYLIVGNVKNQIIIDAVIFNYILIYIHQKYNIVNEKQSS